MPAMGLTLLLPVLMILGAKSWGKKKHMGKGEIILRYVVYLTLLLFASSVIMGFLSDDSTSFFEKITRSAEFAIKYAGLQIILAAGIAVAEWLCVRKGICKKFAENRYLNQKSDNGLWKFSGSILVYILAAAVIVLNVALMFDNVLWGDEAFSAITAPKSMYGILQVLYFWDNHPPLYYYWLKLFGELFGQTVPVYHLASLVPFIGGILLALTLFRKHFGNIPAAFFIIISGLGSCCLEYNLEVRMYALAFCGVLAAFYSSYRVISTGKKSAWISMVFWALVAAYSHYYALAAAGILLFCTGAAVWLKYRGKTWLKGAGAIAVFILAYTPWLFFLFTALKNVSNSWWMTDILGLDRSLLIVMGGKDMNHIIFPLILLLIVILLLTESSLFRFEKKDGQLEIQIHKPSVKGWSDETYSVVVGAFTIFGTLLFAYLLCLVMGPMLAERYLYPLSAVAFSVLVVGSSRVLALVKQLGEKRQQLCWEKLAKAAFVVVLGVLVLIGAGNYRSYSALTWEQSEKTDATLAVIGEPSGDVKLVTNGVKHLGWTVLSFYFPENEVVNGSYIQVDCDEYWFFNTVAVGEDVFYDWEQRGYQVTDYGEMQLSQYPFFLYHLEKMEE